MFPGMEERIAGGVASLPLTEKLSETCFCISILDTVFDGVLREADMIIVGNEQCNQGFKGRVVMRESEICARAMRVGSGTCEVSKKRAGTLQMFVFKI